MILSAQQVAAAEFERIGLGGCGTLYCRDSKCGTITHIAQ
jgi:hypothetical protein